jgi:hypothetical protein
MPSEPKKPIEQMLEALAKARRAQFGDDPKMPNPMRTRLHEEIARAGATEEEDLESRPSWLTRFWPRVTVAAALATLIVLVPAILWNRSHPIAESGELALRDRTASAADELHPAVPAEDTLAKPPAVSDADSTVNLADNRQIKIEPAATPSSESKGFNKEIASAKIQAAPAAAPPASADWKAESDTTAGVAPAVAESSSAGSLGMTQQFSEQSGVQSFRNMSQVSRTADVLNTFQVQQQGNEIRVLDADGSTYTGKIEQLAKNAETDSRMTMRRGAAKQTRSYAGKATPEHESDAPQSYFRATGLNVSRKKTVVFEGNYAEPPPQQPAKATSNDKERLEQGSDRARIVGTVRVNGEAPLEVDAVAEKAQPAATEKSKK